MLSADTLSLVVFWVLTGLFALGVGFVVAATLLEVARWPKPRWITAYALMLVGWHVRRTR